MCTRVCWLGWVACALQPVVVPPKFCDSRVKVLQADARTLPPSVLVDYAPEVSLQGQCTAVASWEPAAVRTRGQDAWPHGPPLRSSRACLTFA